MQAHLANATPDEKYHAAFGSMDVGQNLVSSSGVVQFRDVVGTFERAKTALMVSTDIESPRDAMRTKSKKFSI